MVFPTLRQHQLMRRGPLLQAMLVLLALLALQARLSSCLHCYVDVEGIKRSDGDDDITDVSKFHRHNCTSFSKGGVDKPCMTRTDRNGIVTRNCATITKEEETCEEDDHGALLCYCLTHYCNGAAAAETTTRHSCLAALLVLVSLSRIKWKIKP